MPPASGSSSGILAAGTSARQLWTVKRSRDTTEIDLGGSVINSADPAFLGTLSAFGLRNLHILNGRLKFGAGFQPLTTFQPHTTLRLSSVTLTVNDDVEKDVSSTDRTQSFLLVTSHPHCSCILEDCVFETAFDSPEMFRLVVCMATYKGQVTMTSCKFTGFRRVLHVRDKSKVTMKDCVVDLTMKGAYGGEGNGWPLILGEGSQSKIELTNCQLSISCAYIRSHLTLGFVHLQDGCKAELEGVTFTGRTDLAASRDAPAISMALSHVALGAAGEASAHLKGCVFLGGQVSCTGPGASIHCEDCHFSGYFLGHACLAALAHVTLHRCTVQNLCGDRSHVGKMHTAMRICRVSGHGGSAELRDCVLETVHGAAVFNAVGGQAKLTQCTVRRCGAGPAEQVMTPNRCAAVQLDGPATVDMQQCYVEGGLNCAAAAAGLGGLLTCKDSLLVGWGGGTNQLNEGCPVACSCSEGTQVDLDRCCVQFHPNSRQARDACVLIAVESSLIKARECRLIGPAPGSSSGREIGVAANTHATASLDKCSLLQVGQPASSAHGASVSLTRCKGHQGVMQLVPAPRSKINALRCTNCNGCQECRQPVPLVIPEGTGGSGCSAEVAAKAEALHAALYRSSEPATANKAAAGSTQSGTGANPALVECAVCHRKPGDPGVPATLKLCGGCKITRYCSSECQTKDWKMGHKSLCKWFSGASQKV